VCPGLFRLHRTCRPVSDVQTGLPFLHNQTWPKCSDSYTYLFNLIIPLLFPLHI
jgi:hypothetical protein